MTKEEVKQAFKTGKGNIIAKAMREYFAQEIANG
jgi:type III secretory pathway component EscU